jgi:multidrug resistance efflux pump
MTDTEVTSKRGDAIDDRDTRPPEPTSHGPAKAPKPLVPLLLTLVAVAVAAFLGHAMWRVYMGGPWTRDATVRAYVVTMAPEVSGRIIELPVLDNQYVHKGATLLAIDPTNYEIAVGQAQASVQQAQGSVQNVDGQMAVQQAR